MEEVFELRLSVISGFQQIRCRLELWFRLGRAKGRTCGRTLSCVIAEASPCRPFQHSGRMDDELIMDRYLQCSSKSTSRQYNSNLTKDFTLHSGMEKRCSHRFSASCFKGWTNVNIICLIICKGWTWVLIKGRRFKKKCRKGQNQ